jgi:hypothetical protein
MSHDFWIAIGGQRGAEWERIAGTRRFPVRSPIPVTATLPGLDGVQRVYLLALDVIAPDTLSLIVNHLAAKYSLSAEESEREIRTAGIPILEADTIMIVEHPQRWF